MYNLNDGASEAPLYLVPNSEGTGKRLVRRPHPPPTSAPLPDDFDAITDTRDSTTIYDDPGNSALGIDYDDVTVAAAVAPERPIPIHAPVPLSPTRSPLNPLRQRRGASPSRSLIEPDLRSVGNGDGLVPHSKGMGHGKARSVAGDRSARRSLGSGNHPPAAAVPPMPLPPFPPGKGPAAGRSDMVEKKVLEDGPERTISVWREGVLKSSSEAGDGDGRSELDSHAGRRRRVESVAQTAGSVKGKGHRRKESADFTEGSSLHPAMTDRSSTPLASALPINTNPQPSTPQKPHRRAPVPVSPSAGPKGSEYSASGSDATSQTKVTSAARIESVLSSCQPSLLHLLPILEELGVRHSEHMTALARMREETRDREVKEEALKMGVTIVEWAILIDKLQSL
ncbi:hypothetical protein V8E53_012714 [Lactarius tabidus]